MNPVKLPTTTKQGKRNRRRNPERPINTPVVSARTNQPVARTNVRPTTSPKIRNVREGCVVSHREFIYDVTRNTNVFSTDAFSVNPGLASTFPWLSQIAGRFESYTFERLDFVYETVCSTTTVGSIMMAMDFDAADAAPANKVQIMSYAGATRSAPWQPVRFVSSAIDRKKMVVERYTRTGALSGGVDIKTYDVGNFFLSTFGISGANVALGELYVEYTVRLRTPQITTGSQLGLNSRTVQVGTATVVNGTITQNVAEVVGDAEPMVMATPSSDGARSPQLAINPKINRALFNYTFEPSSNYGSTISTLFGNARRALEAGQEAIQTYTQPGTVSNALRTLGKIPGTTVIGRQGTRNIMGENLILDILDEFLSPVRVPSGLRVTTNSGGPSMAMPIRNATLSGTLKYTIIPLDNSVFPQEQNTCPVIEDVVGPVPVTWPNLFGQAVPARTSDSLNTFTFSSRRVIPSTPDVEPSRK